MRHARMRKLLAMLLALTMALGLSPAAMAGEVFFEEGSEPAGELSPELFYEEQVPAEVVPEEVLYA